VKPISVILPWRGDSECLYRTVKDLSTTDKRVKLFIVFDGEKEEFDKFNEDGIVKILAPEQIEFVSAVNLGYSIAKEHGELFMIWATDCVINSPTWYDDLTTSYERNFPDGGGLLCADDGYWNGNIAIHPIIDRKFIEWIDYPDDCILWPFYVHYGSDNDISELAKSAGRYSYDMELKYYHPSPLERSENVSIKYKYWDIGVLKRRRSLWE